MKHTTRMLVVPEEFFNALIASSPTSNDGSAIGLVQNRMQKFAKDRGGMSGDEQAIKFEQEYKRFNKLLRDEQEEPVNVRLKNLDQVAKSAAEAALAASKTPPPPPPRLIRHVLTRRSGIQIPTKKKQTRPRVENIKVKRENAESSSVAADDEPPMVYESAAENFDEVETDMKKGSKGNSSGKKKKKSNKSKNQTGKGVITGRTYIKSNKCPSSFSLKFKPTIWGKVESKE